MLINNTEGGLRELAAGRHSLDDDGFEIGAGRVNSRRQAGGA